MWTSGRWLGIFSHTNGGIASLPPPEKVAATALVRIVEGDVTAESLKKELARILPVKWEWEVGSMARKNLLSPS